MHWTKTMLRKIITIAAAFVALAGAPALAQSSAKAVVDAAKAQGVVGEQGDGFVGIVSGGDAAVRAAVAEMNASRAKIYAETAAKTGVTPEAAGQATAVTLFSRLQPGDWYKPVGGSWTKK